MQANDPLTLIQGDALSSLREMESESVQCCVTSPPYFGLRSYGTEPVVWGGDANCKHVWIEVGTKTVAVSDKREEQHASERDHLMDGIRASQGTRCACGAWRGELGLEPTPELYVSHLVEVFREVMRVLRKDARLWVNLGDSYGGASSNAPQSGLKELADIHSPRKRTRRSHAYQDRADIYIRRGGVATCKPKDLIGVPWMVAFALRADGWYLRSDIVWAKPNPMPESVTDRPTKSHEYIFLLSKSERYYYDREAIKEPNVSDEQLKHNLRYAKPYASFDARGGPNGTGQPGNENHRGIHSRPGGVGRNRRSVWSVTSRPFADAHFATFPPELPRICVLAGTKAGDVVLDPFAGSGTTGKVAIELGRKAILIEPKAEYIEMIKRRCQTTIGLPLAI